ncbi:MAG: ATP-binding protein, partial [Desulfobulbaceae bacterium]|nr:ATP-binding protein [Desulfobulbaceae bacterium]
HKLRQLEEDIGELIVDVAMSGHESVGLQQNFLLLPLCIEEFLQGHQLIRLAITENNFALLGVDEKGANRKAKESTLGHLEVMEQTLNTMTSAQEPIGDKVKEQIAAIANYRTGIEELHGTLLALRQDTSQFQMARGEILKTMKEIGGQTEKGISAVRTLMNGHSRQKSIVSLVMSGSILAVSLLGLLVAWRMSRHLETTTREAVEARAQQLLVNERLQQEIDERQRVEDALLQARDGLELRVNERTSELSRANAQLHDEITERLNIERNLAEERERLIVTLKSIGDGVISTDTNGCVTLLNQNAEMLTGWNQQAAIGRPLPEIFHIFHEETRQPCENPVEKVLATGGSVELARHTVLISKDGVERSIADSGAPILDSKKNIIGVVLVFRDITDQLRQEKERLNSQKMESIGTLAGGIAHDFNNILSAIVGYTELALMRGRGDENKDWQDDLRQVRKASDRAIGLVQQILAFSRKQQQAKMPLQVSLIVKEALKLIRAAIPATIDIKTEIDSDATVLADATQMHQVIMNLCTNAYHAMMEHGGVLCVTLREKVVSSTESADISDLLPGHYLQLSVSDSGIGMDKATLAKVFDPYFTTKEQGKGTGLGLAVVHGIIRSHQGHIAVDSERGRGTTFTIYLPMTGTEGVAADLSVPEFRAGAQELVMLVDDEGAIRDITSQNLLNAGYRVEAFANGLEAWRAFLQRPKDWDLLLSDQTMPEMTGDELAAKVLEVRPDLPVVICSGYSDVDNEEREKLAGSRVYLQKPVDLNVLLSQISKALEKKG